MAQDSSSLLTVPAPVFRVFTPTYPSLGVVTVPGVEGSQGVLNAISDVVLAIDRRRSKVSECAWVSCVRCHSYVVMSFQCWVFSCTLLFDPGGGERSTKLTKLGAKRSTSPLMGRASDAPPAPAGAASSRPRLTEEGGTASHTITEDDDAEFCGAPARGRNGPAATTRAWMGKSTLQVRSQCGRCWECAGRPQGNGACRVRMGSSARTRPQSCPLASRRWKL